MPRLSEGLILHVRQHEIVWKYIIWTYSGIEEAELWQSRQSRSTFTSLGMKIYRSFAIKAEGKCGGGTSHIWQWRQSVSGETDLQIFGSQDWAKVQKRNCKSLEVQTEMNAEAELHIFGSPGRTSAESGTSDLCQSRQSGSAEAEHYIFGNQGRAVVRKRNFTFLAVNAERKCGRGTSDIWQ